MIEDISVEAGAAPRQRILQAAQRLFYRDGIRATGTNALIAEAGVTKVTFYRHFASKDALVEAFLEARHARWLDWFVQALARHGGSPKAIAPAVGEWLAGPGFRGCAFLNSVGEYGQALDSVNRRTRTHKQQMIAALAGCLRANDRAGEATARQIALAIDGAIMRVQSGEEAEGVTADLQALIQCLAGDAPENDRYP
ncbi:TetR/AcrR family transcriptional regulator [Salinisphaera sp.]|uniref:TetR/AcrR family transcriptional regulator n=1 Tax=Salinisphaera sp. TaxID=1914330 RepID=UPI000C5D97E8|nr:TetR/AcrR family transcriptional regulator [Salinisphaera sp.]MBS61405.1 TetR family transcriptional regulator [Salinisphaera sp.]